MLLKFLPLNKVNMQNNKVLHFFLQYTIIFIICIPIIFFLYLMLYWWFGMSFESSWNKLTKTYLEIWDYTVWKQKWFYNICNKNQGCLDWEILGFKEVIDKKYLYIKMNYGSWYIINKNNERKDFYRYYFDWKQWEINDVDDLPKYWYLSNNDLKLYSKNDLKNLSQEQQTILQELEKNPTIVINWIDYTN